MRFNVNNKYHHRVTVRKLNKGNYSDVLYLFLIVMFLFLMAFYRELMVMSK